MLPGGPKHEAVIKLCYQSVISDQLHLRSDPTQSALQLIAVLTQLHLRSFPLLILLPSLSHPIQFSVPGSQVLSPSLAFWGLNFQASDSHPIS